MLGMIDYDGPDPSNEHVRLRVDYANRREIIRNRLVRIEDVEVGRVYIGRLCEGPFYHRPSNPDSDSREALASIEVQGELREGKLADTNTRPAPGSLVYVLADREVSDLVGCYGDMMLGTMVGHEGVEVRLSSKDKSVLPRNLGIFGTVGSGKSNTCQVVIEEASRAGWCVLVVDVEGEYTHMDRPTEDGHTTMLLAKFGQTPVGVSDLMVYHPANCPGSHGTANEFTLRLADFEGPVIAELLQATVGERNALFEAIDYYMSRNRTRIAVNEKEEMVGLLDASPKAKLPFSLFALRERCVERSSKGGAELDFVGLGGKLLRLMHTKMFDEPNVPALDIAKLIQPGRVNIIDVSAASEVIQNLVTADLLRKSFAYKIVHPEVAPTLLVIEEAHAFISKERVASLHATLEMLRTVTRRGRKRWLSVAFVSQQPGHLPPEIFELCNTRIVHNLRSTHNLEALMATAGDVSQSLWGHVPLLGPGEALLSAPQLRRPVVTRIRPAASQRKFMG
jgi:DNA helicase HerA-like ATPase